MIPSSTLVVRHLPSDFTDEEKEDFLKHFGAIQVKCISSKIKKSNLTFARFNSEIEAKHALQRLHQLDVLGHRLTVEFSREAKGSVLSSEKVPIIQATKEEKENSQKYYEAFLHKLNSWNSSVNFLQPPPAHLRYQYPPPTVAILTNISRALASVPKFYTQVLHLMNKMNLPSPFENIFPEAGVSCNLKDVFPETNEGTRHTTDIVEEEDIQSSEDESEIESDLENQMPREIVPMKRKSSQNKKIVKRPKFVKPLPAAPSTLKPTHKPEEVFEKPPCEMTVKKIELPAKLIPASAEKTDDVQAAAQNIEAEAHGSFGLMFPENKPVSDETKEESEKNEDDSSIITAEELAANRISSRDQKHLPVFKNYQPGIPSCRLYIKNIAKQVTERELHYIYRRYNEPDSEEQGNMFDIRLMKEGRMKGQAFVTLPSMKQAQLALKETNGYILKDKPLVVQFARSAIAKDKM
ncbi:RNA-binding region-containing protein 3-like [Schistocerca americana]|nr:RNA-binding region-containing protein 3-like [Schistocerca americana]XP_047111497.1 RNA-binding region-containing protein 3-like [Schistocerca piceifrons]XP_047111498.1 RNA-binding region-containing protein 3-like [Schistocerca piceifrons]XP_049956607.1 RNA-binding region-containing protein 3-like isoform X2 [Schistocerca serialis cubense]